MHIVLQHLLDFSRSCMSLEGSGSIFLHSIYFIILGDDVLLISPRSIVISLYSLFNLNALKIWCWIFRKCLFPFIFCGIIHLFVVLFYGQFIFFYNLFDNGVFFFLFSIFGKTLCVNSIKLLSPC